MSACKFKVLIQSVVQVRCAEYWPDGVVRIDAQVIAGFSNNTDSPVPFSIIQLELTAL